MPNVDLQQTSVRASPARRLTQLAGGLALYGASIALMVRGTVGLAPWAVLDEAVAERTGLSFGTVTGGIGALVLMCWIPLRQRPGIGTVANVVLVAVATDLTLAVVDPPSALVARVALMLAGVVLNGVATAAYIGVRLGPGPRDGLMTGLAARTGLSIRVVRTGLELTVLAGGWSLGGTVGVGTAVYALAIGPLTQAVLPYVAWRGEPRGR